MDGQLAHCGIYFPILIPAVPIAQDRPLCIFASISAIASNIQMKFNASSVVTLTYCCLLAAECHRTSADNYFPSHKV